MKRVILLAALFSAPLLAADAGPAPVEAEAIPAEASSNRDAGPAVEPEPEPEPKPKPKPKPKGLPKLVVLDLVDEGAGAEVTIGVSEAVAGQALRSYQGQLVTAVQLRVALDAAALQALVGCASAQCMTDIAKKMEAKQILGGSVKRLDDGLEITLSLIDPETGALVRQSTRKSPEARDLYFYAAQQLTSYILTGEASDSRVPVRVTSSPAGAEVFVDEKPAGTAPVDLKLDPGDHDIVLRYPDYLEYKARLTVEEGTPAALEAEMVRARGSLWTASIVTTVLGAVTLGAGWYFDDVARANYDGSNLFEFNNVDANYRTANNDLELSAKRREVTSNALTGGILLTAGGILAGAGVALGVAELFLESEP